MYKNNNLALAEKNRIDVKRRAEHKSGGAAEAFECAGGGAGRRVVCSVQREIDHGDGRDVGGWVLE